MSRYDARAAEAKWQAVWEERGVFRAAPDPSRRWHSTNNS